MILLDTSGIFALADRDDRYHLQATTFFQTALADHEEFFLHSYIIIESAALLQRRLGISTMLNFLQETQAFNIQWVDAALHHAAVKRLKQAPSTEISLVDMVSFTLMDIYGVSEYFGFDSHFEQAGFRQYRA